MNTVQVFQIYPIRELVLATCIFALDRAATEAENGPENPGGAKKPDGLKPKNAKKCKLTNPGEGVTLEMALLKPEDAADAAEFLKWPPHIRRQVLRYGARWTDALFEPKP